MSGKARCRQVYTITTKNSIDFFFRPGPGPPGTNNFLTRPDIWFRRAAVSASGTSLPKWWNW